MRAARILVVVIGLAGCGNGEPRPAPSKAAPAAAPVPTTMDAASATDAVGSIVADMGTYFSKMVPIAAGFRGDCDKLIDAMLTLEPLVEQVRTKTAALERADPDGVQKVRARMATERPTMEAALDAQLASHGLVRADLDRKSDEINQTCGKHPRYQATMDRVGLMKKTKKPPPSP